MISEGSKILVTGGSGYIGNNLIRRLSEKNCDIVSISNKKIPKVEGKQRNIFFSKSIA